MEKPIIVAGGGLVINEEGALLMIFRRGKWDLPKGKLDPGETIEACALREIKEETGVTHIRLGSLVTITRHEYFDPYLKADVIKETHWFNMYTPGIPDLTPQTEEDITEIEWTKKEDLEDRLSNTYPTIREAIRMAGLA